MPVTVEGQPANELADLVGPVWSESKACAALDASRDVLSARREAGTLLGLTTSDGTTVYPVFQFVRRTDGQVEVRPGLLAVMGPLRAFDPWAVAVLLHTPAPELGGSTPIQWDRDGGASEALGDLADAVAREWAAGAHARAVTT